MNYFFFLYKKQQMKIIFLFLFVILWVLFNRYKYNTAPSITLSTIYTSNRHVFLDLGANDGDTTYNFFGLKSYSQGGYFKDIIPLDVVQNYKWEVHSIEANPVFDQDLIRMQKNISEKHDIFIYNSTVAWIYDGQIDFYFDTLNKITSFWGSSVIEEHPDVIKSGKIKKKMRCIDIAGILKKYSKEDFVVIKMDIEGAEYNLLLHFMQTNTMELIDYLLIEYHQDVTKIRIDHKMLESIFDNYGIRYFQWGKVHLINNKIYKPVEKQKF